MLRGINVSGHKTIKMTELKNMFEALEYRNVKTYVQSGNVIFDCGATDTIKLASQIEEKISFTFGFSVKTIIRTENELEGIINNNPFVKEPNIEFDKLHVTLLVDIIEASTVLLFNVKKEENEKFLISTKEVYLYCPNGYGKTKLNNNMFEKKLKTVATTRNWKTINKLLELSRSQVL